ncbi:transposase [Stenotrophomonas sp.]|uniref:REP-associated tyrosine transposase n=1 Tax=Stenotrophomonas sp. TaxID=69392 RepID=UPI0028B1694E|nr:transposase [Stenotrophomonas sp.]
MEHATYLRLAFRIARVVRPFRINAIVVLPDHLHGVWTLPEGDTEGHQRWSQIQAVFDRHLPGNPPRAVLRRDRQVRPLWHSGFREHRILDDADLARHVAYVHENPVKHGHVRDARQWPLSSIHRGVGRPVAGFGECREPGTGSALDEDADSGMDQEDARGC